MSSRPALAVAAVVAAGGLAFFLYQSYKERQTNKKDQTSLNTTSTSKPTPAPKNSTPTSTSAPTSQPASATSKPTPKLAPASASSPPTTSSPSLSSMPPPPLMRNMTLLKIETEEKSAPGTNLSVSVTNQTSTPAPIDHIPDVAYLELDIPRGSTIDGAWDVHAAILAVAIQHVQKSLYITINVDPETLSAAEVSSLLQRYYHLITTLSDPLRGPLFSCTILLSSPTSPSHPRQRVALVPELQSVLVVAGRDGRVGDLNAKRMALENDLPPVVKQIIQVDAGQSAPTTPVHAQHTVKRWNNVVIGGTFDHLHVGHKIMIGVATYVAKRQLVIGLSADELLHNKKYPQYLQSWSHRRSYLIFLIYLMSPALLVDIVPLHDVAGPAGDRKELELLVVSEETRDGAVAVNEIRKKNGLSPLEVFEIKLISSPDSIKISSTIIRQHLSDDTRRERVWAAMEWAELTKILYVDQKLGEKWWNKIESLLDEKHRHYHTLSHIAALLRLCETYKSSLRSYDVVRLAIWFHDVIYDPTKKDNEEQSVVIFEQFASETKLPSWLRSKVIDCINDTKTHTLSWQDDEDEKYFLDMDLAVLGGTQQEYDIYTRGIEKEYSYLDRTVYRQGRITVLTSLLDKDRLYATTDFYDRYEKLARFNIAREIEQLKHAV